jgi:hypothetical protein
MARKKAEKKDEDMEATAKPPAAQARRKAGRRPGPFWREQAQRWTARLGGKQYSAPETIGRANVDEARKWYARLAKKHGAVAASPDAVPAGPTKKTFTFTPAAIADLAELAPMIASETMTAVDNESQTVCIAVHEALAARRARGKK